MLRAITKKGKNVLLAALPKRQIEMLRNSEQFLCPECKESVIVRAGPTVIPHFAHRKFSDCVQQARGESAYHQKGKLLLYEWLKKQHIPTRLEKHIPGIDQRPDLLLQGKKRLIALEFQCATIPLALIKRRNEGYRRADIIPIWILGANQFKRKSAIHLHLTAFTRQFLHKIASNAPASLLYFCPKDKMFSIVNDVMMTSANRALAEFSFRPMEKLSFSDLFSFKFFSDEKLFSLWRDEKRTFRLSPRRVYGKERIWREWLYEKNIHIEQLPSIIHLPVRSQWLMSVPPWNWQSRFIIDFFHSLETGQIFSAEQASRFIRKFQLPRHPFEPFATDPIAQYLAYLVRLDAVEPLSANRYLKKRPLQFYRNIEESLDGDDELLKSFMYNHIQERE